MSQMASAQKADTGRRVFLSSKIEDVIDELEITRKRMQMERRMQNPSLGRPSPSATFHQPSPTSLVDNHKLPSISYNTTKYISQAYGQQSPRSYGAASMLTTTRGHLSSLIKSSIS